MRQIAFKGTFPKGLFEFSCESPQKSVCLFALRQTGDDRPDTNGFASDDGCTRFFSPLLSDRLDKLAFYTYELGR